MNDALKLVDMLDKLMQNGSGHVNVVAEGEKKPCYACSIPTFDKEIDEKEEDL